MLEKNISRFPTDEEIRERAYQIYLEGGRESGHDLADWVAAKMELVIKLTSSLYQTIDRKRAPAIPRPERGA